MLEGPLKFFPVNELKIGCFESKKDQGVQKGDQGIHQVHFSIFHGALEFQRKIGSQQIVEKAGEYGTCTIPDSL